MKALLGIVGGFVLTLAVFGSGLAFAAWLLAAKPVRQATPASGVSELWTRDAEPVDAATQQLQRIPAAQQASDTGAQSGNASKPDAGTRTAALATPTGTDQARPLQPLPGAAELPAIAGPGQPGTDVNAAGQTPPSSDAPSGQQGSTLPAAHLAWCANRYRSYRPQENSYRSYSGELRPCVSPYFDPDGNRAPTEASQEGQPVPGDRPATNARTGATDHGASPDEQMMDDQAEMEGYAPTTDGYAATYGGPPEEISPQDEASRDQASGRSISGDHVDYCFSRYRSYDPRDNTYQPFDGGPRRQCE